MKVGDLAIYYPACECDQGVMPENCRSGCAARCVHQHQDGTVNLSVSDHGGNRQVREHVRVLYPPVHRVRERGWRAEPVESRESGEAVDDPHGSPYCRPQI